MPKNIVVFSDGTGKEGGKGHDSNVYKLFKMVENRTSAQIVFYDRGLGTGWRKVTGSVGGVGISKNILECYDFIFEHYSAGDTIFLFGFSRGATTMRSLSGFMHYFGILPRSRPELIEQAYRIYKNRSKQRRRRDAEEFIRKHHTMWCSIRFLGVWDTVAALGIPFKSIDVVVDKIPLFRHKFHDLRLSPSVENGYHALAIDDERLTFHPTPWDPNVGENQTIRQVWFCGMHSDVGGGYPEQELSDIALEWLVQKAVEHGLRLYPKQTAEINANANGRMHDSRGTRLGRLYRRKVRGWDPQIRGKPVVHESVLKRRLNRDNEKDPPYAPWILSLEFDVEPWKRGLGAPGGQPGDSGLCK